MDEAQIIERTTFIAHGRAPEIAQPGERSLYLPTAPVPVAAPWTPVPRIGALAVATIGKWGAIIWMRSAASVLSKESAS